HTKHDSDAAHNWAEIASRRAVEEHDSSTLYSASAVRGLIAANAGDEAATRSALNRIEILLDSPDEMICYGDAVPFLELLGKADDDIAAIARQLAGRIAQKIDDADFRTRAESIARLQSQ